MEKLYYLDPYLKEFKATVLKCEKGEKGFEVELDKTAFYPEGGGQPCDLGFIGEAKVLYVGEKGESVIHYLEKEVEVGQEVFCSIDWERRFDLMQQHSAEHIVSGIFNSMYGYNNVGFHMGSEMITLDLDGELSFEQVREVELIANEYVFKNVECRIFEVSGEELKKLKYRSKKELTGNVRLVEFPGADLCACCGTHVRYSGEIGVIKMFSCQAYKGGVRIEMLCGKRALNYINDILEENKAISKLLSAKVKQTSSAVERLMGENSDLKNKLNEMLKEKFEVLAKENVGKSKVILKENSLDSNGVRNLANAILNGGCDGLIAVFSGSDEDGYKYAICQKDGDLREFIKNLNSSLNGRGGGKPFFAQGSVVASWNEIERFFEGV